MKIAIKVCLWFLAFVPLVVDNSVFYPYTSGKNLLIESALVLVGILILFNFFLERNFREEVINRVVKLVRQPLVLALLAFIGISILSTVLAVDRQTAFWGELSRAEGLTGLIFFFSFFAFSSLTFEKKDWLWFFKLSLFTSLFLLIKQFTQLWGEDLLRPGSFVGNPTFLAGYLLFSISASLIVLSLSKNWFFKYFSGLVIILSVIGIFIAQTRGIILGLGFGLATTLIYCAVKGKDINYKIFNLRQVSIILLTIGIIFSGVFFFTRQNEIWQNVPGLARVSLIGLEGDSVAPRLFTLETSLQAVNPVDNGWKKLLLGWGPENYILAHGQYYNPAQYEYEANWFDRAHNKILDVFVMTGIFGLLAYLAVWILLFRYILKQKEFSLVNVGLLIFSVSYLVHLLFAFDQITTSVPFFTILAFTVYLVVYTSENEPKMASEGQETKERREILSGCFLVILTLFLSFIYLRNTLPAYFQMRDYLTLVKETKPALVIEKIDSILNFSTNAEMDIKRDLLQVAIGLSSKKLDNNSLILVDKALGLGTDYADRNLTDLKFLGSLADVYTSQGYAFKKDDYLKKGEEYYQKILNLAPTRPDMTFGLGINLFYQRRFAEAFSLLEKTLTANPSLFGLNRLKSEVAYTGFLKYFYEQKNQEDFTKTANCLIANDYENSASLQTIIDLLNTKATWPKVNFE